MEFVEAGVAHQVTPPTITEPPMRTVDVESQRRRPGRTRTGMGFGRDPSTRAPTPIPTAVATMVTIHDATRSTYSFVRAVSFREQVVSRPDRRSVCATTARAASTAGSRGRCRRCHGTATHRCEHREQPDGTGMTVGAGGRVVGGRHRSSFLERRVARPAPELVERHGPSVGICLTGPMSSTETRTRPGLDSELEEVTETGEPTHAHIVKVGPGENAAAKILEARVMGTPVEALCGFVWVPSRDPKQLPVCQECKNVYEMYRAFNDGLRDTPGD